MSQSWAWNSGNLAPRLAHPIRLGCPRRRESWSQTLYSFLSDAFAFNVGSLPSFKNIVSKPWFGNSDEASAVGSHDPSAEQVSWSQSKPSLSKGRSWGRCPQLGHQGTIVPWFPPPHGSRELGDPLEPCLPVHKPEIPTLQNGVLQGRNQRLKEAREE